ncbi:DUF4344 domain-containing metallopeptidase [Roseobacter sinensis]|uniref:DUF4344 domain-containing metallopeptidase n=1 Tax=Roseobacter sinensis TaxID=2931391 RepID=A0ABT3BF65_9RHOB|nr:DUF4344 domain-containing metallopeptidase [Roseobacter sp. WL0113]MCV3272203.1 DUF4344 domain-containing metallopeptidase [Roseobacter sp. WL0113]
MRIIFLSLFFACTSLVSPLQAQSREDTFVEANVLAILYHEMGHALIDILQLPVFGQEEDAADVLSVLLIHDLYEEEAAAGIIYDAAFGFLGEADSYEAAPWGVHGLDLQRYYTMICLFYGANPDAREDLAVELELPAERAETCPEEFQLAYDSWGPVLDEITADEPGTSMTLEGAGDDVIGVLMVDEVAALNEDFILPVALTFRVEACGEANGFYDLGTREIIICSELDPYLRSLAGF